MNTVVRPFPSRPLRTGAPERPSAAPARHQYRARDFGVGYGNSSGYASDKRYTPTWSQLRFRCA